MKALSRLVTASCLLALGIVSSAGCGGPPKAKSAGGKRIPANGTPSSAPVSSLPTKSIVRDDWKKVLADKLQPACDAREGAASADMRDLEGAGKIITSWTEVRASKAKSPTAAGKRLAGKPEPTRDVTSVGLTCAGPKSYVQVNGEQYPFDLAWVVSGTGTGKTLDGDLGAGQYTMIEALSFADQRVVFAKVYVPSDTHDDTDDTVIVSSLAGYLPENPGEPVVRRFGDPDSPHLETFLFSKGDGTEGFSLQVPKEDPLGRARYLAVGRFRVVQ